MTGSALDPRRATSVGGSEVAALFSAGWPDPRFPPWESRLALWHRKRSAVEAPAGAEVPELDLEAAITGEGLDDGDGGEAADGADLGEHVGPGDPLFWGQVLEPAIAAGLERLTGWEFTDGRFVEHPDVVGSSATLDRYAWRIPGRERVELGDPCAPVELKSVLRSEFRHWPEGRGEGVEWFDFRAGEWVPAKRAPPLRVLLQVQQQLSCLGPVARFGFVAALVERTLHLFRVPRHPPTVAKLEAEIAAFWQSVFAGEAPPADFLVDAAVVAELYNRTEAGSVLDLRGDAELAATCRLYLEQRDAAIAARKAASSCRARILQRVGSREKVFFAGGWVRTWDVPAAQIVVQRKASRTLRVTERQPRRKG